MSKRHTPIQQQELLDTIDGAKLSHISKDGMTVTAVWPDGSSCNLYYKGQSLGWCFGNDNLAYEAGYAYACGYRD